MISVEIRCHLLHLGGYLGPNSWFEWISETDSFISVDIHAQFLHLGGCQEELLYLGEYQEGLLHLGRYQGKLLYLGGYHGETSSFGRISGETPSFGRISWGNSFILGGCQGELSFSWIFEAKCLILVDIHRQSLHLGGYPCRNPSIGWISMVNFFMCLDIHDQLFHLFWCPRPIP